jgi:polyisoprenoid-binding protein YceI
MTETAVQGREYQGVSIPPPGTYELDAVHTVVGFVARHMLSKVRGQFTEFSGRIEVGDSPQDSRVEVEVKTESITTHTEKRDQHLMSGDFLETRAAPGADVHEHRRAANGGHLVRARRRSHDQGHQEARHPLGRVPRVGA